MSKLHIFTERRLGLISTSLTKILLYLFQEYHSKTLELPFSSKLSFTACILLYELFVGDNKLGTIWIWTIMGYSLEKPMKNLIGHKFTS